MRRLRLALALAASLLTTAPLLAATDRRELAAPMDAFVRVEVATVALARPGNNPVVLLREPDASEVIPIFIGPGQARSILLALRGADLPRPMTHDLLGDVIGSLDASLARVYVDDIVSGTYLGMLELEIAGNDKTIRVDTRPSDAIALALRTGASIHVAPKVLDAAEHIAYSGLEDNQVVTAVGITVMAPTAKLREALGLPERDGVVVTRAVGPAKGAGVEPGALILGVNGEAPSSPMEFLDRVGATPEGERVRIRYWLDGSERSVDLPIGVPDRPGTGSAGGGAF